MREPRFLFLYVVVISSVFGIAVSNSSCQLRDTRYGSICICTNDECDFLKVETPAVDNDFVVVSSSKGGLRFSTNNGTFKSNKITILDHPKVARKKSNNYFGNLAAILVENNTAFLQFEEDKKTVLQNAAINVNRAIRYQKITGFGGALTGTVSHLLNLLSPQLQDHIFKSYFHKDGIGYNMLRMSIGGSDFDLEPWVYNQEPRNDPQLTNFSSLDYRDTLKVQQISRLKEVGEIQVALKIMGAAWSPPTWMKSNNDWSGFSYLKTEYYQTWANYHLKFLELMDAKNIPIWAISTGNEPLNGVIGWLFIKFMSLGWTPSNQAIWLSENLGPTIRNSKFKNVKIFGNDDQRYTFPFWFRKMKLSRNDSLNYIDGLAVHWYWDNVFAPNLIDLAHKEMPDKLIISTEACIGDKPWQTHGPELGSWNRAEEYMHSLFTDLQHNFNGWIDWNLILDERGGPNYVNNFVDSPIIINTENKGEFYKQPLFYALGHFSKFITEGSVRIEALISNQNVNSVAFVRPDQSIVVIFDNRCNETLDLRITDSVRGEIKLIIPARSIHSVIYN